MTTVFPRAAALAQAMRSLGVEHFRFDDSLLLSTTGPLTFLLWLHFSGISAETNDSVRGWGWDKISIATDPDKIAADIRSRM